MSSEAVGDSDMDCLDIEDHGDHDLSMVSIFFACDLGRAAAFVLPGFLASANFSRFLRSPGFSARKGAKQVALQTDRGIGF